MNALQRVHKTVKSCTAYDAKVGIFWELRKGNREKVLKGTI